MHAVLARERVRERVARAEALLERDRAHHGGLQHAAARLEVVAVLHGRARGARRRAGCPRARSRRPSGGRHSRAVRLDAVRERVEAGRRRHVRGHRSASARIEDRHVRRAECGAKKIVFLPVDAQRDDARAADLAARARRRRHGDHRRHVRRDARRRRSRRRSRRAGALWLVPSRDELADVERRAAADGDHDVGAWPCGTPATPRGRASRSGCAITSSKIAASTCAAPSVFLIWSAMPAADDARVGHDQRARAADALRLVGCLRCGAARRTRCGSESSRRLLIISDRLEVTLRAPTRSRRSYWRTSQSRVRT